MLYSAGAVTLEILLHQGFEGISSTRRVWTTLEGRVPCSEMNASHGGSFLTGSGNTEVSKRYWAPSDDFILITAHNLPQLTTASWPFVDLTLLIFPSGNQLLGDLGLYIFQPIVFSPKMNGTSKPTSQTSNGPVSLDGDIALLTSLLAQSNGSDERDMDGPELQELLRRLETADGVARGVESRLDEVIGNLDQLLGGLEAANLGSGENNSQSQEKIEGDGGLENAKSEL